MTTVERIRVLLLHQDPFTRAGLAATFSRCADLDVAVREESPLPAGAIEFRRHAEFDVVVTDHATGVEIAGLAQGQFGASVKVLIVSSSERECEVRQALEQGVRGYIVIGGALDGLVSGVRAVHLGVRYLCPRVTQRLAESMSCDALTFREMQVLRLVVDGLCNKLIAAELDIAVGTVKSHLKAIFDKLGVRSRTQAMAAAERRGLLSAPHVHARGRLESRRSGPMAAA